MAWSPPAAVGPEVCGVVFETVMHFAVGFSAAALLALLFVPLVHKRAVRLTARRFEATVPAAVGEIRADKDELRTKLATSTRRLEMTVEQMKAKTMSKLDELDRKKDAINLLEKELDDKTAAIAALEARDKSMCEQLRAAQQQFQAQSTALRETEQTLADKEAELVQLVVELGERDGQQAEFAAMLTEIEAIRMRVAQYEDAQRDIELRLLRDREDADAAAEDFAEARDDLRSLRARRAQQRGWSRFEK
jgi:chromosome segregation ATPase